MKTTIKTISRYLVILNLILILICSVSSCMKYPASAMKNYAANIIEREYTGKEIISIERTETEYSINEYDNGTTQGQKLILASGEVYSFVNHPNSEGTSYNYEIEFSYDNVLNKKIVNMLYSVGLFDLGSFYQGGMYGKDIHAWTLTITYDDGSAKVVKGENTEPDVLKKAGYAFYNITGGEFLYSPYGEYKNPSPVNISFICYNENSQQSYIDSFLNCPAYQGVWRGHIRPVIAPLPITSKNSSSYDYSIISLSIQEGFAQFLSAKVYAYTDDFENGYEIEIEIEENFRLFGENTKELRFVAEPDTNYAVFLEFKLGSAEYRLSTISQEAE